MAQTLLRSPGSGQRPAERVGGAHARRGRPRALRQYDRARGRAVACLEHREVDIRVDTSRLQELLLSPYECEITARGSATARGELCLAKADDVLRQRQPRDDRAVATDRVRKPAMYGRDSPQPRLRRDV